MSMTRILTSHLKPSGVLIIADRLKNETSHLMPSSMPEVPEGVVTHGSGFSEEDVREIFEGAGLKEFEFNHALSEAYQGVVMEVFVAKGMKAA